MPLALRLCARTLGGRTLAAGTLAASSIAAALVFAAVQPAAAYSAKVENSCRADYFQHCPGYPVGSASLRLCMESKSKQLSRSCVDALLKAGLVDRRRVARGY